jgi:hypothetical protein
MRVKKQQSMGLRMGGAASPAALSRKQWDGRPHPLNGIDVPKWKCLTTT